MGYGFTAIVGGTPQNESLPGRKESVAVQVLQLTFGERNSSFYEPS